MQGVDNNSCNLLLLQSSSIEFITEIVQGPIEAGKRQLIIALVNFLGDSSIHSLTEVRSATDGVKMGTRNLSPAPTVMRINSHGKAPPLRLRVSTLFSATNTDILNRGNKPTIIDAMRIKLVDVTHANRVSDNIRNWFLFEDCSNIWFDLESKQARFVGHTFN